MKQKLVDQLMIAYPCVFKKIRYIECGDGWFEIINSMCSLIESYISNLPIELRDQVFAEQIKQKFGSLRVYFSKNLSYIDGVIDMSEKQSLFICENCGLYGKITSSNGWFRVLCNLCFVE